MCSPKLMMTSVSQNVAVFGDKFFKKGMLNQNEAVRMGPKLILIVFLTRKGDLDIPERHQGYGHTGKRPWDEAVRGWPLGSQGERPWGKLTAGTLILDL